MRDLIEVAVDRMPVVRLVRGHPRGAFLPPRDDVVQQCIGCFRIQNRDQVIDMNGKGGLGWVEIDTERPCKKIAVQSLRAGIERTKHMRKEVFRKNIGFLEDEFSGRHAG